MAEIKRVINMISGSGSTSMNILHHELGGGFLHDKTRTVAIISSDPKAAGIEKAIEFGFPEEDIHSVDPNRGDLAEQLLVIFDCYKPDFFHQLGWMPLTPVELLLRYTGLNQHFGPGGKWMYGKRRVFAHMNFCRLVGEERPILVFCQLVAPAYDEGQVIHSVSLGLDFRKSPEKIAGELLPLEHDVQRKGREKFASGDFRASAVPNAARNPEEERLLNQAKRAARDKYPPE